MTPIISLVSGTYNRLDLLKRMVQSFRDNLPLGLTYEVVLVDGGSTDGTIEWAKSQTDVVLIEDGELLGAISAFTRGAFKAIGKYVLIANDDIHFHANSVIPAIIHLESNMKCGAVAFRDNRPMPPTYTSNDYKVLRMAGLVETSQGAWDRNKIVQINDKNYISTSLPYAQVGLFRKWLGDKLQWWLGEHEEMLGASVYGGDNSLSGQIWHKGYTVDEVPECIVEDYVANDELRNINYNKGRMHDDSQYFYKQWPNGVIVNNEPQIPQQDRRAARILYLPIYEPGWSVQKHPIHGKHGLRDALSRAHNKYNTPHIVQEFDYLSVTPKELRPRLVEIADSFRPDLILSQIQSPQPLSAELLKELKQRTGATLVNWNGDQAIGGLYSPEMLPILRQIDLQLITNLDVVADYERERIKWDYWQIGYEESQGDLEQNVSNYFMELGRENPFASETEYPVVYLASLRSPERMAIAEIVRSFGGLVETPGDKHATLYNFSTSALLYKRAKVIISDNGFQSRGFVSNRLFQALSAGGGVVLQQHVDGLDELTGLKNTRHYQEWSDLDNLRSWIKAFLGEYGAQAQEIAALGTAFVRENFSFDAQVMKLMALIKKHLGEGTQLNNSVALKYKGRSQSGFGLGNAWQSGTRYEYQVGKLLWVKKEDVDQIMSLYAQDWERILE